MHFNNEKVIEKLGQLVALLKDEPFKAKAFGGALAAVKRLGDTDIANVITIKKIPGIGPSSVKEIIQILETGTSERLVSLLREKAVDVELMQQLMQIPGIGPSKADAYIKQYKLSSFSDLKVMIAYGEIKDSLLVDGIKKLHQNERIDRMLAEIAIKPMFNELSLLVSRINLAGSIRRKRPTIRDIDIVCCHNHPDEIKECLQWCGLTIVNSGMTKIRAELLVDGKTRGCDIVIVPENEFACALMYLTGSKEFNIEFRSRMRNLGYSINEHCVSVIDKEKKIYPSTEEDIFKLAGMSFVSPEKREA